MGRTNRRATAAALAKRHATELAKRIGAALKDARNRAGLTQKEAARRAGLSQTGWSRLEVDGDPRYTILTLDRAAFAVGASVDAFIRGGSAADQPRDATQLRTQELIMRLSEGGDWDALPEELIDREAKTSRAADVLLHRRRPVLPTEYALIEVIDWFADVGQPMRDWSRRLEAVDRYAVARMVGDEPLPRISGCWVVRATSRNRELIGGLRHMFAARFPGSGQRWLRALANPGVEMPAQSALLWVSVKGDRLFPARLG